MTATTPEFPRPRTPAHPLPTAGTLGYTLDQRRKLAAQHLGTDAR